MVLADTPPKSSRGKRPSEIAGAITEFLTDRAGAGCLRGRIKAHFEGRYAGSSVYKELNKMLDGGLLIESGGIFALPGRPGPMP